MNQDIFVHNSHILAEEGSWRSLEKDEKVEFILGENPNTGKEQAERVTAPGGAPVMYKARPEPRETNFW